MADNVSDNKYVIPYLTGNHTFADWASHYNTTVVNKLNLMQIFNGASGDGIVFTLGTTHASDPLGGLTSGPDLASGTFRCSLADVIPKGITFSGDVSIDGTLKYNLAQAENTSLNVRLYSDKGFTGTKGFTFGMPIRVAKNNPFSEFEGRGCTGDATYSLGKADSIENAEVFGVVSGVTWPTDGTAYSNSNTWIEATVGGRIKGDFSYAIRTPETLHQNQKVAGGLSAGVVYFLSPGSSGGITPVEPGIAGQVSKPMILGITADEGMVLNYRGQFLKGSGTGGTGGINDNRFIVSTTNADLVRGIVTQFDGNDWTVARAPDELTNSVGLIVNRFVLDSVTYIEIVSCGHVDNIPVLGDGGNGNPTGLVYVDSNGKLSSVNVPGSRKPFAVVWPSVSGSGLRRGVIINQTSGGGGGGGGNGETARSTNPNGNWAYRSTVSGGATYGSAINNNILINGDFDIWQRSIGKDSAHGTTGTTYFADRWVRIDGVSGAGGIVGTYSLQRQEFSKNQTDVFGHPKYYLSSSHTIAGTGGHHGDRIVIQNRVEDVRTANNQDVTLSFHAKCGITGATMGIVVNQYDGTNSHTRIVANSSVGSVWGKHEVAFTMPKITTTPTNKHYVGVGFDVTKMNTTFDLAKVKLERGLVATTNPPSNEDDELRDCSRYYQRSYNVDENTHSTTMLDDNNPTVTALDFGITPLQDYYYRFPTRMREIPTVTFFSPKSGQTADAYNRTAEVDLRKASGTYGYSNATRIAGAGVETIKAEHRTKDGVYIVIPAGSVLWDRISVHYVADAELNEDMPNSG